MSLRCSFVTVGRLATARLPSSALALALPLQSQRPQTRLSSTSQFVTLTPPWKFEDLTRNERKAFERWGPSYFSYLTPEQQEHAQKLANKRAELAVELEKEFGKDWYSILREATDIKDRQEREYLAMLHKDAEYRKCDSKGQKKMIQRLFDEEKSTKAERLREIMQKVARNRGKF